MLMTTDFLCIADLAADRVRPLLALASSLKSEQYGGGNRPILQGKSLAMVFQKPSLRTRASFDIAMSQVGGHAVYLGPDEIRLGHRESVPDAARVLSRYADGILARVFAHADVVTLSEWASVPVINGLSDYCHPCQGMADLLTIQEKLGGLEGVKLAYLGDGNNVLHTLMFGAAQVGMHVVAATPPGYEPLVQVVRDAKRIAEDTGSSIEVIDNPAEAVSNADVIYTDTWTSMGQEDEAEERRRVFPPYQVNADLLAMARPMAGVMHCLPAHRGEEITDDVADAPQSWLFDQAENRLHAQKAILVDLLSK